MRPFIPSQMKGRSASRVGTAGITTDRFGRNREGRNSCFRGQCRPNRHRGRLLLWVKAYAAYLWIVRCWHTEPVVV